MRKTSRNLIIITLIIISGIGILFLSNIVFTSKEKLQAIENGTGVLKLRLRVGQEDSTYSLGASNQSDLTLRTIQARLDRAGFNTNLESQYDGLYSLAIDNVSDTTSAKRLITDNIIIGLWETVNSDLYKKIITDTTNGQNNALLDLFSPYENSDNSCALGSALLEDTALVNQIIKYNIIDKLLDNVVLLWGRNSYYDSNYYLYTLSPAIDGGPSVIINDYIEDIDIIENTDYPGVYSLGISLNVEGAHLWSMFTRNNISENLAFTLNYMVCMPQSVNAENTSGKFELDARLSNTEALYAKAILLSGNLQIPVQIVDEEFITMSDNNNVRINLMLAGVSLFILLTLLIFLFYMLLHNKNHTNKEVEPRDDLTAPDTSVKTGKILYRVLCTLLIVFSIVYIVKALTGSIINLSDLVQGITLTIITVTFCMKRRFGWFYMLAFWLLLILVALVTLFFNNSLLGSFLFLILISIPIIVAILSKQVRYAQFGIIDQQSELIKKLILPIIILAATLLLLPKLIFLLLY